MLKVKERRDFLAHHFFRERAEDILTRSGLDGMIAELERDQSLFKAVDQELERAIAPKRLEFGIKEEFLEKYFEEFLKQIRRNETSDN